jgi:hypothetical protein
MQKLPMGTARKRRRGTALVPHSEHFFQSDGKIEISLNNITL